MCRLKGGFPVKRFLITYLCTLIVLVPLDVLFIGTIGKKLFADHLSDLMLTTPRAAPAILFYLLYVTGVVVFVISAGGLVAQSWLRGVVRTVRLCDVRINQHGPSKGVELVHGHSGHGLGGQPDSRFGRDRRAHRELGSGALLAPACSCGFFLLPTRALLPSQNHRPKLAQRYEARVQPVKYLNGNALIGLRLPRREIEAIATCGSRELDFGTAFRNSGWLQQGRQPVTDSIRRNVLKGAAAATTFAAVGKALAQTRSDEGPRQLEGQPMPEPPSERSAGPIRPGRGTMLTGKVAVVTGAARGIGRAIAVELAANGADVVAVDIAGYVSSASNAVPATSQELNETVGMIKAYGRRGEGIKADIRDVTALRQIADHVEQTYGKIDIVVASAAIQRWVPLLEMEDADWRDVIDNNLNGTANTVQAFAPKMVARKKGRFILLASMQGKHGTKDASSYSASKWGILGLMKSAAMELGEHNITVNALIPGLVDTALTATQSVSVNRWGSKARRSSTLRRKRPGTIARQRCRSRSDGCSRTTSRRRPYSSLPMRPIWSPARSMRSQGAIALKMCS
jgi:NAD(P)-dependent dehydrogenase (short-subunit alcohol dehydrogenase family)